MHKTQHAGLSSEADRVIRRWEERRQWEDDSAKLIERHAFCIAVSREAGARGGSIARVVGQRLGWTVYDQDLLEYIAGSIHLRASVLEGLSDDEFAWSQSWLASLLGDRWADQDCYIVHLSKLILAIGIQGDAIIVGRGASCIIPRDRCLGVRLVGADKDRVSYLSQLERLTPQEAEHAMRERDEQRARFVRDYFGRDDAHVPEYDMILDSSTLGEECCAELIITAAEGKRSFLEARSQGASTNHPSHVPSE